MSGPLTLWAVSELFIFQPNTYDNNKLIFIFFAFLCGLCAKFICVISLKLKHSLCEDGIFRTVFPRLLLTLNIFLIAFTVFPLLNTRSADFLFYLNQGNVLTVLFIAFLIFITSAQYILLETRSGLAPYLLLLPVASASLFCLLLALLYKQKESLTIHIQSEFVLFIILCECISLIITLISFYRSRSITCNRAKSLSYAFYRLSGSILICVLFLSGTMTIAREWVSSYQVFSRNDMAAADYIKENTSVDSVFLTSYNWHLNAVSTLTGRNIVCGPDLYLYFHGIDTAQRKRDIDSMFIDPEHTDALFQKYNVSYLYIGPDERYSMSVDIDYINDNFEKVYDNGGIQIFKVGLSDGDKK